MLTLRCGRARRAGACFRCTFAALHAGTRMRGERAECADSRRFGQWNRPGASQPCDFHALVHHLGVAPTLVQSQRCVALRVCNSQPATRCCHSRRRCFREWQNCALREECERPCALALLHYRSLRLVLCSSTSSATQRARRVAALSPEAHAVPHAGSVCGLRHEHYWHWRSLAQLPL